MPTLRTTAIALILILANHGGLAQQGNVGNAADVAAACVAVLDRTQLALREKVAQIQKSVRERCTRVVPSADNFWRDAVQRLARAKIELAFPRRRSCDRLDVSVDAHVIAVIGAISDGSAIDRIRAGLQQALPGIPIDTTRLQPATCGQVLGNNGFVVSLGTDDKPQPAYRPEGAKAKELPASADCQDTGHSIEADLNDIVSKMPGSDKSFWVDDVDAGIPVICAYTGGGWKVIAMGTKSKRAFIITRPSK